MRAPACGRTVLSVSPGALASERESRVSISYSNTNTVATNNVATAFRQYESAMRKVFEAFRYRFFLAAPHQHALGRVLRQHAKLRERWIGHPPHHRP